MADFHSRLIELRKEKGLSQYTFAAIMETSRSTISGYETEGKEPSFAQLITFAKFFDVSTDFLLGLTNQRNNFSDDSKEEVLILSPDEKELIKKYRKLNKTGAAYLRQQAEIASTMYNK